MPAALAVGRLLNTILGATELKVLVDMLILLKKAVCSELLPVPFKLFLSAIIAEVELILLTISDAEILPRILELKIVITLVER
jgi:hypothetical protein